MKRQVLSFITIILIVLSSCSKDSGGGGTSISPTANYSYAAVGGNTNAPSTINFTNTSTNASSYSWNFGDGGSSTQDNPSHKYIGAGTYTVTLTATLAGKTSTKSQTINIQAPYTKIAITAIQQLSTTETSSFTGYFRFTDNAGNQLWRSGNVTINPASLPVNWTISSPYLFTNLLVTYQIQVWKVGTFSDTQIAGTAFIPSLFNTGDIAANSYPTFIPGATSSGLNFTVQWQP